jgi:hypothetical protein
MRLKQNALFILACLPVTYAIGLLSSLNALFLRGDRQKARMIKTKPLVGHPRLRLDSLRVDGISDGEDDEVKEIQERQRQEEAIEHRIF